MAVVSRCYLVVLVGDARIIKRKVGHSLPRAPLARDGPLLRRLAKARHNRVVKQAALASSDAGKVVVVHYSRLILVNLPIIQIQNAAIRRILHFIRIKAHISFWAILFNPIFVDLNEIFLLAAV